MYADRHHQNPLAGDGAPTVQSRSELPIHFSFRTRSIVERFVLVVLDEAPLGHASTQVFLHSSAPARLSIPSSPCAPWKILASFCFLLSYHDTPRPRKLFFLFGCYCASASSSRSFVWRDVGCGGCRHSVFVISTDGACRLHPSPSPPFHAFAEGTEPMVASFFLQLFLRWLEGSCAVGDGVPWSNDVEWKGRRGPVTIASVDASTRAGIVSDVPCTCRTSTCDGAVHSVSKRRPTTNQGVSSLYREETPPGPDPPWVSSWRWSRFRSIPGGRGSRWIGRVHRDLSR